MSDSDLTTGALSTHFRNLAVPAAIGMVFSTLYNVVDVFYAGLIGTSAQAGMALGFQALFLIIIFGFGLASAVSALVGNALGGKRRDEARSFAVQGVVYGVIMTLLLSALGWFFGPSLIKFLSVPGAYQDQALIYFQVVLFSAPGFILAYDANGILQAQGDNRSMQRGLTVAFFANIGLNPLLMFGVPGLWDGFGAPGIALATVISQTGVMAYIFWQVYRTPLIDGVRREDFRVDLPIVKQITGQTLPASFTLILITVTGMVVQFYLKNFGDHAVAAYGIALRIEQLFLLPVFGLTGALLPIAAQNFGAQSFDRVRQSLMTCWRYGFIFMAAACPLLWLGGPWLMSLFTRDAAAIEVGVSYLRVDGVLLPLYMMLFSINSFLQALKQARLTLWIGLYRHGFAILFFIWLGAEVLGFGIWGIWLGVSAAVTTGLALSLWVAYRAAQRLL